jgi:hypothetical protein
VAGEPEDDEQGFAMRRIIAADELAKALGISVDEVFQIARTRQVPWSMTALMAASSMRTNWISGRPRHVVVPTILTIKYLRH